MNVTLHIGIQRTGTTFLQQDVFPNTDEINLVNFDWHGGIKYNVLGNKEINDILVNIEDHNHNMISDKICPRFEEDKINLISEENIYCNMWSSKDKRFERIEKVKQVFPSCKVIFGIRDKKALLLSWYKKYIVNGGTLSFRNFQKKLSTLKNLNLSHMSNIFMNCLEEKMCIFIDSRD